MKVSVYSTGWDIVSKAFDYKSALDNWFTFADEVCVAVPSIDTDESGGAILAHANERGYNVRVVRPSFSFTDDPFAYGKTENAALQACTGDLLIQQNLDERMRVTRGRLEELHAILQQRYDISAFWVPTIDLYGSAEQYLPSVKAKWYIHRPGLFRGACREGIKPDGRPDYNKTSSDELLDMMGNLVATAALIPDPRVEALQPYVAAGWPLVYHLGYLSLKDRLDRSIWWKSFWETATGGDKNTHPTSIEELAAKATQPHNLPLWPSL